MKNIIAIVTLILIFSARVSNAQTDVTEPAELPKLEKSDASDAPKLNKLTVGYERDNFNLGFSPWDQGFVSLGHKFEFGSVIARYNRARRFDTDGEQWEADAYPSLWQGAYGYLNYGRSNSSIYPRERYGAEVFQSLGGGFEASAGFRKLEFTGGGVTLFTGSIAYYYSNYYFYIRPYHTPSDIGASDSWTLGFRSYLDDEQYWALAVGQGLSVEPDFSGNPIGLKSQKASADIYLSAGNDVWVHPGIGFRKEEIRAGVEREMWAYDISLEKRF